MAKGCFKSQAREREKRVECQLRRGAPLPTMEVAWLTNSKKAKFADQTG
jgi:hypothetical protein